MSDLNAASLACAALKLAVAASTRGSRCQGISKSWLMLIVLSEPSVFAVATLGVLVPFKTSICGLGMAWAVLTAKRADSTALDAL